MKAFCCRPGHPRFETGGGITTNPRVQMFVAALPPARREAIAARPRFYRIPWIRRAGEADSNPDDFLP